MPSRDIIAPILKVGALRGLGITLHMLLATERQQIPYVVWRDVHHECYIDIVKSLCALLFPLFHWASAIVET